MRATSRLYSKTTYRRCRIYQLNSRNQNDYCSNLGLHTSRHCNTHINMICRILPAPKNQNMTRYWKIIKHVRISCISASRSLALQMNNCDKVSLILNWRRVSWLLPIKKSEILRMSLNNDNKSSKWPLRRLRAVKLTQGLKIRNC